MSESPIRAALLRLIRATNGLCEIEGGEPDKRIPEAAAVWSEVEDAVAEAEEAQRADADAHDFCWHVIEYTVAGAGPFPFDMLRYDSAVFATEQDGATATMNADRRHVRLRRYYPHDGRAEPERRRWESFGWRVVGAAAISNP